MPRPVLLLLIALFLGCDKSPPPTPAGPRKLVVLGTAYALAQIAAEVGGESVQTDWLVEQGQSLDALEPNNEINQRLARADLLITNGSGEEWAAKGFDDSMHASRIIRLDLLKASGAQSGARELWLDPAVARELAQTIADRLALQQPAKAANFRQNAERFSTAIDSLNSEFASKLAGFKGQKVLVLSNDFTALTRSVGLEEVCPVVTSALRITDDNLSTLRNAVKSENLTALLVEAATPIGVQQDLGKRLGVRVIPLDSLGTSAGIGRNTYQAILRYDLQQLLGILS